MSCGRRERWRLCLRLARLRLAAAGVAAAVLMPSPAAAWPRVGAIAFSGNQVTQASVMLRETVIRVGDPADPDRIERSRQGIQDLGLFKWVAATQTPMGDGTVRLTFVVAEKWYVLPLPRYDVNSDGQTTYGTQLRWFNAWGLNHTVKGSWAVRDDRRSNTGSRTSYGMSYDVPFVQDTPYGLSVSASHQQTPVTLPAIYDETVEELGLGVGRSLDHIGPASVGWGVHSGLDWSRQDTSGAAAPPPYGEAYSLSLGAGFQDVRDNIYSDEGRRYGLNWRGATQRVLSDYSYSQFQAEYKRYVPFGGMPHQTFEISGAFGTYAGGPMQATISKGPFSLGGSSRLRAHEGNFLEGNVYYYLGAEVARPVYWNWLRVVGLVEAGNVFEDFGSVTFNRVYADAGIGLRLRVTFLVNIEVEAGVAFPLEKGPGHVFASRL